MQGRLTVPGPNVDLKREQGKPTTPPFTTAAQMVSCTPPLLPALRGSSRPVNITYLQALTGLRVTSRTKPYSS